MLRAGPAGLAAAGRAAPTGLSAVVLDRAAAVGGMAASVDAVGVRVDHGTADGATHTGGQLDPGAWSAARRRCAEHVVEA